MSSYTGRMIRAGLILLAATALHAGEADRYFERGLDYLKRGHFPAARAAFAESLVRAPAQPVTTVLLAVAAASEGYKTADVDALLALSYRRLPADRAFGFDLAKLLPKRTPALWRRDLLRENTAAARRVLAFLETHDADPLVSKELDRLEKEKPRHAWTRALLAERKTRAKLIAGPTRA